MGVRTPWQMKAVVTVSISRLLRSSANHFSLQVLICASLVFGLLPASRRTLGVLFQCSRVILRRGRSGGPAGSPANGNGGGPVPSSKTSPRSRGLRKMLVSEKRFLVEWGDCDPANIVFYPRYLKWFDACTTGLFAAA